MKVAKKLPKLSKKLFILTFDLEEWFHILDVDSLANPNRWDQFEIRIYENTYRILDMLKKNNLKATFFVLGWIAKKYPDLVRLISNMGYEIGTHSSNHILIYNSSPSALKEDLKRSIDTIQSITNRKVRAFRAPGFSIKKESMWVFQVLAEEGIEVDSSIFPASRSYGGINNFALDSPFLIKIKDRTITEFPINIFKFWRFKIPFSGGGYFRSIPYPILNYFINKSDYLMTYFHPRDFDPSQRVINGLPWIRKFHTYYGLRNSFKKLKKIIERYDFIDIQTAIEKIDWNAVPLVTI